MDALIAGIVSAVIAGVIVAWFKISTELANKNREENMELRFTEVKNKIIGVDNSVTAVKNDIKADINSIKGQLLNITKSVHEVDKKTEILVVRHQALNEKVSDFGRVIRRDGS